MVLSSVNAPEDIFRFVVLAQTIIVAAMYSWAGAKAWWSMRRYEDLRFLRYGRMLRDIGIIVLLGDAMLDTISRLGHDHVNYKTPLLQLVLIVLIVAWHLVDRREYRVPDTGAFQHRLVEAMAIREMDAAERRVDDLRVAEERERHEGKRR